MINIDFLIKDLELVRKQSPLIHNITNLVVMNNTANALLAIGASPVMAHALDEVAESQFSYANLYVVGAIKTRGSIFKTVEELLYEIEELLDEE